MPSVVKNYAECGGETWVVNGKLEINGTIDRSGVPELSDLSAAIVQHYQIAPDAASATAVHAAVDLVADETVLVETEITNPDYPRVVTVKGNAAGIAGNVVITGTNILDEAITDTIALNGTSEVLGAKAFKTVDSILMPALTTAGDAVSVGIGKKFGLPHIVYNAACVLVKLFNGSADTGTLAVDAAIEKNLFALNGSPDGTKIIDLYYMA